MISENKVCQKIHRIYIYQISKIYMENLKHMKEMEKTKRSEIKYMKGFLVPPSSGTNEINIL